eukprot:6036893-Pleurochrysis_carterae.AAC.3
MGSWYRPPSTGVAAAEAAAEAVAAAVSTGTESAAAAAAGRLADAPTAAMGAAMVGLDAKAVFAAAASAAAAAVARAAAAAVAAAPKCYHLAAPSSTDSTTARSSAWAHTALDGRAAAPGWAAGSSRAPSAACSASASAARWTRWLQAGTWRRPPRSRVAIAAPGPIGPSAAALLLGARAAAACRWAGLRCG